MIAEKKGTLKATSSGIASERFLIGIQLIVENAPTVLNKDQVSHHMKYKIGNLKSQCEQIEKLFWEIMGEDAELLFNQKVKEIEDTLNKSYGG